jgi:hypothetical protein
MSDTQDREKAREKAELRLAFRWHAVAYTSVNLLLVGIWYFSGAGLPWFLFPLGGWGIGLAAHGFAAYGSGQSGWVDRETERILAQERRKSGYTSGSS